MVRELSPSMQRDAHYSTTAGRAEQSHQLKWCESNCITASVLRTTPLPPTSRQILQQNTQGVTFQCQEIPHKQILCCRTTSPYMPCLFRAPLSVQQQINTTRGEYKYKLTRRDKLKDPSCCDAVSLDRTEVCSSLACLLVTAVVMVVRDPVVGGWRPWI